MKCSKNTTNNERFGPCGSLITIMNHTPGLRQKKMFICKENANIYHPPIPIPIRPFNIDIKES